jgi:hypothetical protein
LVTEGVVRAGAAEATALVPVAPEFVRYPRRPVDDTFVSMEQRVEATVPECVAVSAVPEGIAPVTGYTTQRTARPSLAAPGSFSPVCDEAIAPNEPVGVASVIVPVIGSAPPPPELPYAMK